MIVQPPAVGDEHLVIEQLEHTRMAGQFAAAWGNDAFSPLAPKELMEYVVLHHDEGWDIVDAAIGQDASTGLPYNLVRTPIPDIIKSGARGPALNERQHAFCGLVSSMHTYGLYTGRYGMSDKVFVDMVPAEHKPAVEDLLATERARQARLRGLLADSPATAAWVEDDALWCNYKRLQFFDTLSLYFNCAPEPARGREVFDNVPRVAGEDVSIAVERVGEGEYRVSPYPFGPDPLRIDVRARRLAPQPPDTDMRAAIDAAPAVTETITLRS